MSPTLSIKCDYPDLPVVKRRQEFLELLKNHQVIITSVEDITKNK